MPFRFFYLQGPLHVTTALWCLIAFLCLRWSTSRATWIIAVLFLAAGIDGDAQTLAFGVVPIAAAAVITVLQNRRLRLGYRDLSAAISSVVVALVVRRDRKGVRNLYHWSTKCHRYDRDSASAKYPPCAEILREAPWRPAAMALEQVVSLVIY